MKKISTISAIILFLALSVFSINTAAQTFENKPNDLLGQLTGNSVEGVWDLNINESDDLIKKIQTLIQKYFCLIRKRRISRATEIREFQFQFFHLKGSCWQAAKTK